ncbi:MAG: hypothetical protein N2D54_01380, partial [Chloroflexota bacterium]
LEYDGAIIDTAIHFVLKTDKPQTNIDNLRENVGESAVELLFRRYLSEKQIPHAMKSPVSFAAPDTYQVSLGGRRCIIVNRLVTRRNKISAFSQADNYLLNTDVVVLPGNQKDYYHDDDLFIFTYLAGVVTRSQQDLQKAYDSGQPLSLFISFPEKFSNPLTWGALGEIVLKADTTSPITIILSGLNSAREKIQNEIVLSPKSRTSLSGNKYYALNYMGTSAIPYGRIGVHASALGETVLIGQYQWGNLQIYGKRIYLAGYLSVGELEEKARYLHYEDKLGHQNSPGKTLTFPLNHLHPLNKLFEKAVSWEISKKNT